MAVWYDGGSSSKGRKMTQIQVQPSSFLIESRRRAWVSCDATASLVTLYTRITPQQLRHLLFIKKLS
ncbi:hypothetical protein FQA47_019347 [Oryzias melastigma]|uniref:Uncharacterized protein n=1 Tax=Oryzias melastigma TaxID=30732 RepID=A0A834BZC4_ORYME|nr:hypothetical protein FQA47_019347 [Oryzias melastigma]